MNLNCPRVVEKLRQKKKDRRAKHKERMLEKSVRRNNDRAERLVYWSQQDELTRKKKSVKRRK